MKKLLAVFSLLSLMGCSSISLVENWKNPDIVIFNANKVLLVGMTKSTETRENFESLLLKEFTSRNVEAMRSVDVFDLSLTNSKKTEKELNDVEQSLLDKDFDAILLTKITGSENREKFIKSINRWDNHQSRFNDDYLEHQGIYYDDNYYEKFTVYHAETTLYCICEGKERAMIWRGIIDITDPNNVEKAVKDYVKLVIVAMEDQDLVFTSQIE
jgi:RNA polymerase subunit RPABC4/transcription elongation factor Spt4